MSESSKAWYSLDPEGLELFTIMLLLSFTAEAYYNIPLAIPNGTSGASALLQRST